jgi:hypothetical protein
VVDTCVFILYGELSQCMSLFFDTLAWFVHLFWFGFGFVLGVVMIHRTVYEEVGQGGRV